MKITAGTEHEGMRLDAFLAAVDIDRVGTLQNAIDRSNQL